MIDITIDTWQQIRVELERLSIPELQGLLDSAALEFDGAYTITAESKTYAKLCQYYPLLDTLVQDVTGKRLKLSLQSSVPMGTLSQESEEAFIIDPGASNLTEAIISPESIVAIPAYLLRFVPYVGSSAVLIATALRQAFYRASREHGADQLYPKSGDSVTVDVNSLLDMLGNVFSRATFFRVFKSGKLDWFVRRAEPMHRFIDGKVTRAPNTYTYQGMLLTPGDAQDLFAWFQANMTVFEPSDLLAYALECSRNQILTFPFRTPLESEFLHFTDAISVHEVFQSACGLSKLSSSQAILCDRLASHLIRPESFLAVPWYWFHRVLPELGSDLGMLYLMCRNCCYVDWAHGKDRNTIWVQGGLGTLQKWIGSETLPKRIPQEKSSARGRPRKEEIKSQSEYTRNWRKTYRDLAGQYLCRIATRSTELGTDWQLRVNEVQLTQADEIFQGAIYGFLLEPDQSMTPLIWDSFAKNQVLYSLLLRAARYNPQYLCHFETLVQAGLCQNDTLEATLICHYDTLVDSLNCHFETLVSNDICQFEPIIKILYKLKDTKFFYEITQLPNTTMSSIDVLDARENQVGGEDFIPGYDLDIILNRINPILRKQIQERQAERSFISWMIYGSLTSKIHNPLSFAVSRTLDTGIDAGGPAARLALLPAHELAKLLLRTQKRIESGYLGWSLLEESGAEDLNALMQTGADSQTQLRLIQRLLDNLEIKSIRKF
jgi:hypothetical protein